MARGTIPPPLGRAVTARPVTGDPLSKPERPAMRQALAAVNAERRKPTEADAPPVSTFPMTPAAREALRMTKASPGYRARKRGDL